MKYANEPDKAAERLDYLANFQGSELGEVWRTLSRLWISYKDYLTPEFEDALEKAIIAEAENCDEEYELVEKETKEVVVKYNELVYRGPKH